MEKLSFTVDAGIINRLGLELVAKSETALAELIKNAYDADANTVKLYFERADLEGGELIIDDDGVGMDRAQLVSGFMRLATSDKIHNSVSEIHKRPKAGRKGIGRFSTHRLGKQLTILTQTENSDEALCLKINWDLYKPDREIADIVNELTTVKRFKKGSGTTLIINQLREKWSEADIKRVYRYVSGLIQPNLLLDSEDQNISTVDSNQFEGFEVNFYRRPDSRHDWISVADPQLMMFNRALVTFSGSVDRSGQHGKHTVKSKEFKVDGKFERLIEEREVQDHLNQLQGATLNFKVYYFIGGDRNAYYGITKTELKSITDYLDNNGGVKLYRNGFRVPKYGDADNDWLDIDKNSRIGHGVPFNNNRLLGFVELIDPEGQVFEESAGREGLIEKEAFNQMQSFISNALKEGFVNFASWFRNTDEYKSVNPDKKAAATASSVQQIVIDLKEATKTLTNPDSTDAEKALASVTLEQATKKFVHETNVAINELEMMRVLAGTGLTIAEFVHEIKQVTPSLKGYIKDLLSKNLSPAIMNDLKNMNTVIASLEAYTSYFDESFSRNVVRELIPVDIRSTIETFEQIIANDIKRRNIKVLLNFKGQDLVATPMHPSEWNTILQNLYSNAKKAVLKSNQKEKKILINCYKDIDKATLFFEFHDNGVGISSKHKTRIFDPFFTTNRPVDSKNSKDYETGTGLGLYILNQMIRNRNGIITVGEPSDGYKTNISIQLPLATKLELQKYGY